MAFRFSRNKRRHIEDGAAAEQLAARYLGQQGLQLVERNYRVRGGEIDLILRDGEMLVFVEVRLRRSACYGGAAASIDNHKQARVLLAARHYLGNLDRTCRFDVLVLDDLDTSRIEWLRNAFGE